MCICISFDLTQVASIDMMQPYAHNTHTHCAQGSLCWCMVRLTRSHGRSHVRSHARLQAWSPVNDLDVVSPPPLDGVTRRV